MEERLGQGWPTVCVSLWSCSDYWLTTPWTHLLVSTCSTGKITTTDLKMTLGCLFLRCGESTGKKKQQQLIRKKIRKWKSYKAVVWAKTENQSNAAFKTVPWKETPRSQFIDFGRLTVQKLLKIVDEELSQRRPFWPLQSIEQLLDFGGDATVDCNTYTIRLEDTTR